MTDERRRRRVIQAIRLTWLSLDSHLDYASKELKDLCTCPHHVSCGDREFHSECAKEYAFVVQVLTEQL